MGVQAMNFTRLLINNPAEAWNSCHQNLSRPNITSEQKKEWEERLQKAEQAIADKRKTDAKYALHIKLSLLEKTLDKREAETPRITSTNTPPKSNKPTIDLSQITNQSINASQMAPRGEQVTIAQEVEAILKSQDWVSCQKFVHSYKTLQEALNICNKHIPKNKTEGEFNSIKSTIWKDQLSHVIALGTFFQKATSGQPNDALDFCEKQMLSLAKTPPSDVLYTIHSKQLLHWNSLEKQLNKTMLDVVKGFINPKPSKGIDLDYYHKSILSISNLIPFIKPKQFPKLHKIATDGDKKIDEKILQTFLRTLGISATISLATALTPLLKIIEGLTLTISILGSIVLVFPALMAVSLAYIFSLIHYRNQALMTQLRSEFNSYEQKTV